MPDDTLTGSVGGDDLRADLTSAFDGPADAGTEPPPPAPEAAPPEGDEPPPETTEEGEEAQEGEEAPMLEGIGEFKFNDRWTREERELFAKQPPEVQALLIEKYKGMEAAHTKRSMEIADMRREIQHIEGEWTAVSKLLEPHRQAYRAEGMTDSQAIGRLVAAHEALQRDPANAIAWLVQSYAQDPVEIVRAIAATTGLDLTQATAPGAATAPDPAVQKLMQEVNALKSTLTGQQQALQHEQQGKALQEIEQFANAKDEQGQPLHPHFDDLADDIVMIVKGARAAGKQITLQDAYDRALYANPNTRQKVLAAEEAKRREKADRERKEKAEKAKKASSNVRATGGVGVASTTSDSLRADLEKAFDGAGRI